MRHPFRSLGVLCALLLATSVGALARAQPDAGAGEPEDVPEREASSRSSGESDSSQPDDDSSDAAGDAPDSGSNSSDAAGDTPDSDSNAPGEPAGKGERSKPNQPSSPGTPESTRAEEQNDASEQGASESKPASPSPNSSSERNPASARGDESGSASTRKHPKQGGASGEQSATAGAQGNASDEEVFELEGTYPTAAAIPYFPNHDGSVSWDAELVLGGGFSFDGEAVNGHEHFLARARAGFLLPRDPWTIAFGATGSVGGLTEFGGGLEIEVMSVRSGFGMMGGVEFQHQKEWVTHLGIAYTLVSVEWQHRFDGSNALFFNVRAPFGTIALML